MKELLGDFVEYRAIWKSKVGYCGICPHCLEEANFAVNLPWGGANRGQRNCSNCHKQVLIKELHQDYLILIKP